MAVFDYPVSRVRGERSLPAHCPHRGHTSRPLPAWLLLGFYRELSVLMSFADCALSSGQSGVEGLLLVGGGTK